MGVVFYSGQSLFLSSLVCVFNCCLCCQDVISFAWLLSTWQQPMKPTHTRQWWWTLVASLFVVLLLNMSAYVQEYMWLQSYSSPVPCLIKKSFPSRRISPGSMFDQPTERLSKSNTELGAVFHDTVLASKVKNAQSRLQYQCTCSHVLCDQLQRACFITDQHHLLAVASNININRNIIQQVQCVFALLQRFLLCRCLPDTTYGSAFPVK